MNTGKLIPEWQRWRRRVSAAWARIPCANGGILLRDLRMPDFREYAVPVTKPGAEQAEATRVQGLFLRDVLKTNMTRISGSSGRTKLRPIGWTAVFEVTDRSSMEEILKTDEHVAPDGRVMESTQRASVPGMARRISVDWTSRVV